MSQRRQQYAPSRSVLLRLGVAAFLLVAAITAPASLIAPFLHGAGGTSLTYQEVRGTIWRGEMRNAQSGELFLGDVSFAFRPLHLLTGVASADISVSGGAATGKGRVGYALFSRGISLTDANIEFDLSSVRQYSLFGLPYQGKVQARKASLSWTRAGCQSAGGEIWTDVLDASSKRLVGESLLLAGPLSCNEQNLIVALAGGNAEGSTDVSIAVTPQLTYHVVASVEEAQPTIKQNLRMLGFEENGGALVYDAVGALKGTGS